MTTELKAVIFDCGAVSPEQVISLDDLEGNIVAAEALNIRSLVVDGDGAKTVADLNAVLCLN